MPQPMRSCLQPQPAAASVQPTPAVDPPAARSSCARPTPTPFPTQSYAPNATPAEAASYPRPPQHEHQPQPAGLSQCAAAGPSGSFLAPAILASSTDSTRSPATDAAGAVHRQGAGGHAGSLPSPSGLPAGHFWQNQTGSSEALGDLRGNVRPSVSSAEASGCLQAPVDDTGKAAAGGEPGTAGEAAESRGAASTEGTGLPHSGIGSVAVAVASADDVTCRRDEQTTRPAHNNTTQATVASSGSAQAGLDVAEDTDAAGGAADARLVASMRWPCDADVCAQASAAPPLPGEAPAGGAAGGGCGAVYGDRQESASLRLSPSDCGVSCRSQDATVPEMSFGGEGGALLDSSATCGRSSAGPSVAECDCARPSDKPRRQTPRSDHSSDAIATFVPLIQSL